LNREYLLPPIFGLVSNRIKQRKVGIIPPFYNCGINKDIKIVFDIGANIGEISKIAANSFPEAHIYSFEPVSSTYQRLCENMKDFGDRIHCHNFGFFNTSQVMDINITSFNGANSLIEQSKEHKNIHPHIKEIKTEEIQLLTLDSFVSEKNIEHIDLVKIDVEGVEKEVIEGGLDTFRNNVENVFIELSFIRKGRDSTYWLEICQLLYDLGFALINIYDVARYNQDEREYVAQIDAYFSKKQ